MLVVTFVNDGTGDEIVGNYNYTVRVNGKTVAEGRITNHNRLTGWKGLVSILGDDVHDNDGPAPCETITAEYEHQPDS